MYLNQICFYWSANLKPAYLAILALSLSCKLLLDTFMIPFIIEKHGFLPQNTLRDFSRLKSHADLTLELMDKIRPLNDEHAACLWFTMIYQFKLMRSETSKFSFTAAPHLLEVLVLLGGLCSYMRMSWNTSKSKSISSHIIMEVPNCFKTSLLYNTVVCSSLIMRRVVFLPSMNKRREWLTTPLGTLPQIIAGKSVSV